MSAIDSIIKKYQESYHAVVPFDPANDKIMTLTLSESNKEITPQMIGDPDLYCKYIKDKM
jgi:hypothetical protein